MTKEKFSLTLCFFLLGTVLAVAGTTVSIEDGRWHINGEVTYPGQPAEGLLMNVRMVNAVFEDDRFPSEWPSALGEDFNPEVNTATFIEKIPEYAAQGVRAFTIGLQGGMPGYEGAVNSAFRSNGGFHPRYMERVQAVIEACNEHGVAVILSCFYQRQHGESPTHSPHALTARETIETAVDNVARWIKDNEFRNVLLEISNEYAHAGFGQWRDGNWLRSVQGQISLIERARQAHPDLLVSTSGMGNGTIRPAIADASDFILIHFNTTSLNDYTNRISRIQADSPGKPIVVNEDNKIGSVGAEAAERAVEAGASWGFMHSWQNQYAPFKFEGPADDPEVYSALRRLTLGE